MVYNEIYIKPNNDIRIHDDFTFTLQASLTGLFVQEPTVDLYKVDSLFGLEKYPLYISTNSPTNL